LDWGETLMFDRATLFRAMAKNAHEKTKFVDLPIVKADGVDVWVDFGCADGEITCAISTKLPGKLVIGYDRHRADEWAKREEPLTVFESNFEKLVDGLRGRDVTVGVFLGSVLHEAYTEGVAPMVWEKITQLSPSIVVVRDMMLWPEPSDSLEGISVGDLLNAMVGAAEKNYPKHWEDFKLRWCKRGTRWKEALHFFLKYRYRKNWSWEVREDYLVLTPKGLLMSAEEHGFYPIHMEAQSLSYLQDLWKKDMGIEIDHPTHGLFVFKNRRFA
jgi:hypothetical protein